MDANGLREIEAAVQNALNGAGIEGKVALSGRTMTLRADGSPVEIDAMYLVEQWPLLPVDLRERKAADIAMRLSVAHKAAKAGTLAPTAPAARYVPSVRPTGVAAKGPAKPLVLPLGGLVLLAAMLVAGWFWLRSRPPAGDAAEARGAQTVAPTPSESDDERHARLCGGARASMLKNNTLPQGLDPQSWLAELWLATSRPGEDMTRAKEILALIDQGKLTASADPDLAALPHAQVEIVADGSAPAESWRGAYVRFRGGYAGAFFDKDGREKMNRLAGKLADATGAEMAAFYGRCEHLPAYHDVGAWFRGASPAHAAAALVYAVGFFSEQPRTNRDPSAPPALGELTALTRAFSKLEKGALETEVGQAAGKLELGVKDRPTLITFSLGGPALAVRASGPLATRAGFGKDSPRPAPVPSASAK